MYSKVALLIIVTLIFSGCSTTNKPTPKAPTNEQNITQIVVEDNSTVISIDNTPPKKVRKKRVTKDKYNLKPEPFSLESNEDDPELLGPQTTLDRGLEREEVEEVEEVTSEDTTTPTSTQQEGF